MTTTPSTLLWSAARRPPASHARSVSVSSALPASPAHYQNFGGDTGKLAEKLAAASKRTRCFWGEGEGVGEGEGGV